MGNSASSMKSTYARKYYSNSFSIEFACLAFCEISASSMSHSLRFRKHVMSAAFCKRFWERQVANCDKQYTDFDTVNTIQLHVHSSLLNFVGCLMTCFNTLSVSWDSANKWRIDLALNICLPYVRRKLRGTVTMNLKSANHMTRCHRCSCRRHTILLLMIVLITISCTCAEGKEKKLSCWMFFNKLSFL